MVSLIEDNQKFGKTSMQLDAEDNNKNTFDSLIIPTGSSFGFWVENGYKVYINGELISPNPVFVVVVNEGEEVITTEDE